MSYRPGTLDLVCDMTDNCDREVTMIDDSGFVYCTSHGLDRRSWKRCRKMRRHELNRLARGDVLAHY